jgi:hypothetical protein
MKIVTILAALTILAGCGSLNPSQKGAVVGGVIGGATGAVVTGGTGTLTGAAIGTGVGAGVGYTAGNFYEKNGEKIGDQTCSYPSVTPVPSATMKRLTVEK